MTKKKKKSRNFLLPPYLYLLVCVCVCGKMTYFVEREKKNK